LAQNKRAVDPNVQATTADVKGKRVATWRRRYEATRGLSCPRC
jgi:hypothetical protein